MLIITRRKDEVFHIQDNIRIQILDIKGTQVRIGIDAPREIEILREEVRDRIIKQANE